jgi:hypothetical protein
MNYLGYTAVWNPEDNMFDTKLLLVGEPMWWYYNEVDEAFMIYLDQTGRVLLPGIDGTLEEVEDQASGSAYLGFDGTQFILSYYFRYTTALAKIDTSGTIGPNAWQTLI